MTRILLVGTDFSPSSDRAFAKACELGQSLGAGVHLLHVLEPVDEPGSEDPETQDFYASLTTRSMDKLAIEIAKNTRPVQVECSVVVGPRDRRILEVAEELDAEIVVLGSLPISADSRRLAISHRVAVTAVRPVLLVP